MTLSMVLYKRPDGTWWIGHHGVELRDPESYARRLEARGVSVQVLPAEPCRWCDEEHPPPYDGGCLI